MRQGRDVKKTQMDLKVKTIISENQKYTDGDWNVA